MHKCRVYRSFYYNSNLYSFAISLISVLFQLSDTESSLVWSITHDRAKALIELSDEQFVEEVNHAFVSFKNIRKKYIIQD